MSAVAVIGGGIGGLSAACALAADGHEITLLERAARFEAVGAGLVLTANAVRPLARLGVDLGADGQVLTRMQVCGRDGRSLSAIDLAGLADMYGPSYGIARPRLHSLLVAALPPSVTVILGAAVTAVAESDGAVTVTCSGSEDRFDAVVAADGLRSAVRTMVGGPGRLRYSHNTCWRGIVELDSLGSGAVEAWGDGSRVGVVPVGGDRAYYYLVRVAPAGAAPPASIAGLKAVFAGYAGVSGRLVDALTEWPPLHHDLFELDQPYWGRGRVLLLGDAAHAMTPNQGQGAAMAIEDSVAVAGALRPGPDAALERYRAARGRRVRQAQLASRRIGLLANLRGPGVATARDALARLAPPNSTTSMMRRLIAAGLPSAGSVSPPRP